MGSTELKITIVLTIFFILYGLVFQSLGFSGEENLLQRTGGLQESFEDLDMPSFGIFGNFVLGALFALAETILSLFGVSVITTIGVFPLWVNTLISFMAILLPTTMIMYLIDRIWLG